MPRFRIHHITRYSYEEPVRDCANQVMLYPVADEYQEVVSQVIEITGNPQVNLHADYYDNQVGTFTYAQPHYEMIIQSNLVMETRARPLPQDDVPHELQWAEVKGFQKDLAFIDFLMQERFDHLSEVTAVVEAERCLDCTPFQSARDLCKYVYDTFEYKKGITTVETTLDEIWNLKSGVCQDFAHMLLAMLRILGIPARYVSGYVCPNKGGMRGEGATHAWVEAYLPYFGWVGLDPTNNCFINEMHIKLAVGKNFSDCSPVKGTYRGTSKHSLEVAVAVTYEDGHVTQAPDQPLVVQPVQSVYRNSFRKHQEIQMQQ